MIQYVLFCVLWSKPEVKLIETKVNEYAMATMNENFGDFNFYADVIEEKVNSLKLTHLPTQISTFVTAPRDYQQRSLYTKLEIGQVEGSLDCEMRQQVNEN